MFQFKQFVIHQDRTPMKVGTDGVLLGAWARSGKAASVLDIGTGTGLIALMTAQRNRQAQIEALEIEPNAIEQARQNISRTPWAERIQLIPIPLQKYFPPFQYDCILCNPPFFVHSTLSPEQGRTVARHSDTLPHTELIRHVARLLKKEGNFSVILPPREAEQLISFATEQSLYLQHITYVIPNPGKAVKRYLMEFITSPVSCTEDELIVEYSRHEYSPEYIHLTKDFYLKF